MQVLSLKNNYFLSALQYVNLLPVDTVGEVQGKTTS